MIFSPIPGEFHPHGRGSLLRAADPGAGVARRAAGRAPGAAAAAGGRHAGCVAEGGATLWRSPGSLGSPGGHRGWKDGGKLREDGDRTKTMWRD